MRRCPREKLREMIKNVVAITSIQINLMKNVGNNLKTGVSFCLFRALSRNLHFVTALVKRSDPCHCVNIELCCSFKPIVGGMCGFDTRDKKKETQIIPLLNLQT